MDIKSQLEHGRKQLESGKKPYETASFLLLIILLGYQWITMLNMYLFKWANNETFFRTGMTNLPAFVNRLYNMASPIGHFTAPLVYIGYLFIVFYLVWLYCRKRGHAKWTWTLIVLFAPNIFLIPPMVLYAAYAFRVYLYRFFKGIYHDFIAYDYKQDMEATKQEENEYQQKQDEAKAMKEAKKAEKKTEKQKEPEVKAE